MVWNETRLEDPLAYRFINKLGAADGRLEVDFAEGRRLVLEWKLFLADGGSSSGQGLFDAGGGFVEGTCLASPEYPGTIFLASDGGEGWFTMSRVGRAPDGCEAGARGDATGCFAAPPDDPR